MPSPAPTIVLVEDDYVQAELIRAALSAEGYVVALASTVTEGWRCIQTLRPALVLTDLVLPDELGTALCERIRQHAGLRDTPIILLTVKERLEDKVRGFASGADHYLVKPYQISELCLWVGSLLRRVHGVDQKEGVIQAESFAIDPQNRTVTAAGRAISDLTGREFQLLYELVRYRPKVLSRSHFMRVLGGTLRDNTIEVHIKNIRAKLGEAGKRVMTVHGLGYRFE